jgi:hypothetical protein
MDGVTFNYHYMKQVHIRPGGVGGGINLSIPTNSFQNIFIGIRNQRIYVLMSHRYIFGDEDQEKRNDTKSI